MKWLRRPQIRPQMEWLRRPLVCDGEMVAGPLDPMRLTDADLREICLRMHVILDTIEMVRCEGRWIPTKLFDAIDTLDSIVRQGHGGPARLVEWKDVIHEFGRYYDLDGHGPIMVDPAISREHAARYSGAQQLAPDAATDGGEL